MVFDWTINFGHILTIIGGAITILGLYVVMKIDIRIISERILTLSGRIINVENDIKELVKINIEIATSNERARAMDDRMTQQAARMTEMQKELENWKLWFRNHDGKSAGKS